MTINLLPALPLIESSLFPALKAEMGLTEKEGPIGADPFARHCRHTTFEMAVTGA
ncbi:MAG: hypothetical protein QM688_01920 [Sphingomonas bacterium]